MPDVPGIASFVAGEILHVDGGPSRSLIKDLKPPSETPAMTEAYEIVDRTYEKSPKMIIAGIEAIPLRIPFKTGAKSDASAWGDSNLRLRTRCSSRSPTDQGLSGGARPSGFEQSLPPSSPSTN